MWAIARYTAKLLYDSVLSKELERVNLLEPSPSLHVAGTHCCVIHYHKCNGLIHTLIISQLVFVRRLSMVQLFSLLQSLTSYDQDVSWAAFLPGEESTWELTQTGGRIHFYPAGRLETSVFFSKNPPSALRGLPTVPGHRALCINSSQHGILLCQRQQPKTEPASKRVLHNIM